MPSRKTRKKRGNTNISRKTRLRTRKGIHYAPHDPAVLVPQFERTKFNPTAVECRATDHALMQSFKNAYAEDRESPQSDFYTYTNHRWIKAHDNTKTFYTQIDNFRIAQEHVYIEMTKLARAYIRNHNNPLARKMDAVLKSFLHLNKPAARKHVQEAVRQIDARIAADEFYPMMADMNKNEVIRWGAPIVWDVTPDLKNPQIYRSSISAPELSLYDYEAYLTVEEMGGPTETPPEDKKRRLELKRRFIKFVGDIFTSCLGKNHGLVPSNVWEVERELMILMGCNRIKKYVPSPEGTAEDFYHVISGNMSTEELHMDWSAFTHELGYRTAPKTFICTQPNYVRCLLDKLLHIEKDSGVALWRTPKWKAYYVYMHLRQIARFHQAWRIIYYEFHGKYVQGQEEQWPIELYPVFGLSMCFNTTMTHEYTQANWDQAVIDYTTHLGGDLLEVFKRTVRRNTWMAETTKAAALKKLDHIRLQIGRPDKLRPDPVLAYESNDAYGNLQKIAAWRTHELIRLDGHGVIDIPVIDWKIFKFVGTQAYTVNAYYTPAENKIYVPLAYLRRPFVDLQSRGIEYNLAHLGYTLGHEMSHSLDDMGSQFDHLGRLTNWWTDADRRVFKRKIRDVVQQYEHTALRDGIHMDATLSTGENLADISGLAICVEYLRDLQEFNRFIMPVRALSFETFFFYIAVQGRQHINARAIDAQLHVNPHPLDKYRVNCPLARIQLFRALFNIHPNDPMYWKSADTIW